MSAPSPEAVALIARLIAYPTVSRDSNRALIDFVRDYLLKFGIESQLFLNDAGDKANLLASIGPLNRPGILLSGHSDVVPVDGQNWSHDPFAPAVIDGRLYGRGACDMKGFLGLMLALVPTLAERRLAAPVHLAFSYDEEVGCAGVRSLVAHLAQLAVKPAFALVGEPTDMRIVSAHKGIEVIRTTITGKAAHSSLPDQGANALFAMGDLLGFLARLARALRDEIEDARFEPPFTSLNAGMLRGGNAVNIIADHAVLDWEFRPLPGADADAILGRVEAFAENELLPRLKTQGAEATIRFERIASAPALAADGNIAAETLMRRLLGANDSHAVSFTTEAGLFQTVSGIPAIVCGPGSINEAHKPDEFVSLDQLARAENMLRAIAALAEKGL